MNDEVKENLSYIISEIEKIASDHEDWLKDISQELLDIHSELNSATPEPKVLAKSFKALAWGASVTCKATIEKLVSDAVDLLGTLN